LAGQHLLEQIFQSFEQDTIDQPGLGPKQPQDLPGQHYDRIDVVALGRLTGLNFIVKTFAEAQKLFPGFGRQQG
jgi:hypothetical protein